MPRARKPGVVQADVPTGLPYGQGVALHRQIAEGPQPVGAPPPSTAPPPVAPGAPPPALAAPVNAVDAAKNYVAPPTAAIGLARPTERPTEPVTSGVPVGAGPGPGLMTPPATGSLSAILANAARASGSSDLALLAQKAKEMGQ